MPDYFLSAPDSFLPTSPLLLSPQEKEEEKARVAGGSKWTYEATFLIAMKGGQEYYTTAALGLGLGPLERLDLPSELIKHCHGDGDGDDNGEGRRRRPRPKGVWRCQTPFGEPTMGFHRTVL